MSTQGQEVDALSAPSKTRLRLTATAVAGLLLGASVVLWFTTDGTDEGDTWLRSNLAVLALTLVLGAALACRLTTRQLGKAVLEGAAYALCIQVAVLLVWGFLLMNSVS